MVAGSNPATKPTKSLSARKTAARQRVDADEFEHSVPGIPVIVGRRICIMALLMAIDLENARERMVLEQLERRGIKDPRVLAAMRTVARHRHRAARAVKQESWIN